MITIRRPALSHLFCLQSDTKFIETPQSGPVGPRHFPKGRPRFSISSQESAFLILHTIFVPVYCKRLLFSPWSPSCAFPPRPSSFFFPS